MDPELIIWAGLYGLCIAAALAVMAAACVSDFRSLTIPNIYPVALALLFLPAYGAGLMIKRIGGEAVFGSLQGHGTAFAMILILTFLMYIGKIWGAGDSKLAAAVALWVGLKGTMPFLIGMTLSGIALVALALIVKRIKIDESRFSPHSWPARLRRGENVIPYGIPIVLGAVWAFIFRGYFNIPI